MSAPAGGNRQDRPRRAGLWRAGLAAVVAGVVVAVFARWLVGVPVFWAVGFALPVAAFTLLATAAAGVAAPTWQVTPVPDESLHTAVAATLAERLAEAARDPRRFQIRVQPRLRALALAGLRQRPDTRDLTTLDDERARRALGEELHTLLTDPAARLPEPRRLTELLRRLEGHVDP